MSTLADLQARFINVLQQGPSAFPEGMFAGDRDRTLLGLKAHANTISHARLVALEQSFPRTLARLGGATFNRLSRDFIERPEVMSRSLRLLGECFADFLQAEPVDPASLDLARIEWAWLESYHAADLPALGLCDLAGLDEAGLLDLPVVLHPAVRMVRLTAPLAEQLPELPCDVQIVLISRPDALVLLHGMTSQRGEILAQIEKSAHMRNFIDSAIEIVGEAAALPHVLSLIEAGALASPHG
ncbi:putative DNA-binding domain-containing protein [Blastomonas sp.]|uniref:HvfC/BufC family peptide modification chaperone n=1 Tax=Blastomonas sp. TaxID=1909299 RepID=UPI0035946397